MRTRLFFGICVALIFTPTRGLLNHKIKFNFEVKHTMKTFNKTLIAAATLTTFGLAAAPAAVALDASASVATSYLWRGLDLGSGTPAVSADVSTSSGGFTAGVWVSSGDTAAGTEYDLYASYGGEIGGLGYSVGIARYNYPTGGWAADDATWEGADLTDHIFSLSYGGVTATVYDLDEDGTDYKYNTVAFDLGSVGVLYGDHDGDAEMSHVDLSYGVTEELTFTVSKVITSAFESETDATVVASYTLPF
jgi:hypothetical protein